MTVSLISLTPDAEKQILFCARVSSDQHNEAPGLLKYLIDHKHWSPFEMAHAVFEVHTDRAIAAQILRHRSFSFQEFSQRYSEPNEFMRIHPRRQAETNRQSSTDDLSLATVEWFERVQESLWEDALISYKEAIAKGISKESARFLLPLSTKTKLYMSGTLRSYIHYFDLRCDEHTQQEHRTLACQMRNILMIQLPYISAALDWEYV